MENTIHYNTIHMDLIKSYMGNDYEFKGDWQTLMPIVHKIVTDGSLLTWKIARIDGKNGYSCSLGSVVHTSYDGYICLYTAVIHELQHWNRMKDMYAQIKSE